MSFTITKTICSLLSCIGFLLLIGVINAAPPKVQQQARLSELLILGELTPNSTFINAQHTEVPSDGLYYGYGTSGYKFTRIEIFDRSINGTGGVIEYYTGGLNESDFSISFGPIYPNHINVQVRLFGERLTAADGSYLPNIVTIKKEFK